jgi:hypothetical protein
MKTALLASLLALSTGCSIDVQRERAEGKDVEIRTPVADLSVKTEVPSPDIGLAPYPQARPLGSDDEPSNANVNISSSLFGVNVQAAKYETDDAVEPVAAFYRRELAKFGDVTECRGRDLEFRKGGTAGPQCGARTSRDEVQLGAGTDGDEHIVVVKPRGTGAEVSLVAVKTR